MKRFHELWLGTEASFEEYVRAQERMFASERDDEEEVEPQYYDLKGDIAVISVKGPLTNSDSWLNMLFGLTSYSFIRNATIEAALDDRARAIVLDIDSGGGSAAGVSEAGRTIVKVDRDLKPVYAYTGGSMYSAAYWLGCAARGVYGTDTAGFGSIGVIATHMDHSGALKQEGVKATILRAGKYKAMGHPLEPLTEQAREIIQGKIDALYGLFKGHVGEMRNKPAKYVEDFMAQGREFLGAEAFEVGLIDGVMGFDDLIGEIEAKLPRPQPAAASSPYAAATTNEDRDMPLMRKTLTEKEVSAIAAGVPAAQVAPDSGAPAPAAAADPTPALAPAAPAAPASASDETPVPPAATAGAGGHEDAQPAPDTELVTFLKAELAAAREQNVKLMMTNSELEKEVDGYEASLPGLKDIAVVAINRMRIACGGTSADFSKAQTETLLHEYMQAAKVFTATFPVGGLALVASTEEPVIGVASGPSQAHLRAVRIGK